MLPSRSNWKGEPLCPCKVSLPLRRTVDKIISILNCKVNNTVTLKLPPINFCQEAGNVTFSSGSPTVNSTSFDKKAHCL